MSVSPMLKTFFWCVKCTLSLCIHCKIITKNRGFYKKKIVDFQNLMKIEFCWRLIFFILINYKPSLGLPQNLGPIGSAVTFMGHKQTDKQAKYI